MLKNKVALITGAASGIGKAMAESFAKEGAKIGIADINLIAATEVANIIKANGGQALPLSLDVTDEASVDNNAQTLLNTFGTVDILISNAGIQHIAAIDELNFHDWQRILAIHLDGAFLTSRACIRIMKKQATGGSIILMGSAHSKLASALKAPYVTAKHGLLGLARVIAKEGAAFHIRSNVICPGYVLTPLVEQQIPEQAKTFGISEQEVVKNIMLKDTVDGEFTTLKDITDVAIFLAAFPTNALTGQSILVSHGWFME